MANKKITGDMRLFIWFAIIFIILVSAVTIALTIPYNQRKSEFNDEPEQISRAEVTETLRYTTRGKSGKVSTHYRAYFKLADGTEKEFIFDYAMYKNLKQGETGVLYYKDLPRDTMDFKSFVKFEKDETHDNLLLKVEATKQPSLFRTYVIVAISTIFSLGIIWITLKARTKVKSEKDH